MLSVGILAGIASIIGAVASLVGAFKSNGSAMQSKQQSILAGDHSKDARYHADRAEAVMGPVTIKEKKP